MKRLLYLSGAPRVSTRDDSEAAGPRAHVLGTIEGFRENSFRVEKYVVGDINSPRWSKSGSEKQMVSAICVRLLADVFRICSSILHNLRSFKQYGKQVDVVYERFGAFQNLGFKFKKHGILWILETNSPLFYEASTERKSIFFTRLCKKMEIQAYKDCDFLVCVTTQLKNILVEQIGISPEKIIVLPNGVDTVRFNPGNSLKVYNKNFTIGFVGILAPWCGVDILIRALSMLKERGSYVSAVIVGDGMMLENYKELSEMLGVSGQIDFVGRVSWSSIPTYISNFDVAYSGQTNLQIGKMYHSPLKIYEYMAMGKAVIASSFEDAEKMIRNGQNGFLFKSGNIEELSDVIQRSYLNFDEFKNNSKLIREIVVEKHSWAHRIYDLISICNLNNIHTQI